MESLNTKCRGVPLNHCTSDRCDKKTLLLVMGEEFDLRLTNTDDEARLDVKARGFYRQGQCAFFDIRIANLNVVSNKSQATEKILLRHENEKKRAYNRRVIKIEQEVFTPLVFGTNGAMGKECAIFHKILAKQLAVKYDKPYSTIMSYLRTKNLILSFKIIFVMSEGH